MDKTKLTALLVVFGMTSAAHGQSINISFAGDNSGGTAVQIAPSQIAGIVPAANWNAATGENSAAPLSLNDDSGNATPASVTWTSNNVWGGSGATTDDEAMVNGWLDDGGENGAIVDIAGIPFDSYDVYVYSSSDAGNEGRGWTTRVNGVDYYSGGNFENITPNGSFFDGTYVDAFTDAADPSFFMIPGLFGPTLSIVGDSNPTGPERPNGNTFYRGSISGIQIVETGGGTVSAQVNTVTGAVSIVNSLESAFEVDFIELTSESGAIDSTNLAELGTGTDDGSDWETLILDDNEYSTFFLTGSETLESNGGSIPLGQAFRTDGEMDLEFRWHAVGGITRAGLVQYVDNPPTDNADFDGNGQIDGADELILQRNFGTGTTLAQGDANGDGAVDGADQAIWNDQFGTLTAAANSSAVPEPGAALLLLAAAGGLVARRRLAWLR